MKDQEKLVEEISGWIYVSEHKKRKIREMISQVYSSGISAVRERIRTIDWRNAGLGNTPYDSEIIEYYEKEISNLLSATDTLLSEGEGKETS